MKKKTRVVLLIASALASAQAEEKDLMPRFDNSATSSTVIWEETENSPVTALISRLIFAASIIELRYIFAAKRINRQFEKYSPPL